MPQLAALLDIALDLSKSLTAADRYQRLLAAVRRAVPCDAATLLRVDGDDLVPFATSGLSADAMGQRFPRREHPRLDAICGSRAPVLFPSDSPLPDPFDGLVARDRTAELRVHACLGCPLRVDDELVAVLTADALDPTAFRDVDLRALTVLGALAGAAVRTSLLIEALERRATHSGLVAEELMRAARERDGGALIGTTAIVERLRREIALVGASDFTVLITGETGAGKEVVARALHDASPLRDRPLIHVNCAALPESVAEAELFGHVRGAFTGATGDRPGKFEIAQGGTILLDEIGELPLGVQPKLLRVLQNGEIQRVGADRPLHVRVRVLAATNRDLEAEVRAGRFRADLYHRLAVYPIHVPPLRDRRDDVALLAGYFCDGMRRRLGLGPVRLDAAARAALDAYDWPGNVRELQNLLARVVLRAADRVPRGDAVVVGAADLQLDLPAAPASPAARSDVAGARTPAVPLRAAVDDFQRRAIRAALERHHGNWAAAARSLGLHRSNLHHLANRLGLRPTRAAQD